MPLTTLDSLEEVRALAEDILDGARTSPVVAVTTRHGESRPPVDAETLAAACETLPVYVIRTGELTWELTAVLPPRFEVYGGAARIWWPGLRPSDDPHRHPLIFCWSDEEGPRTLERLLRELRSRGFATTSAVAPVAAPERRRVSPPSRPPGEATRSGRPDRRPEPRPTIVVDQVLEGVVKEAQPGGADIEIAPGVRGWLVIRPRMGAVKVGDRLWVRVAAIDPASGKLALEPPPRDSDHGPLTSPLPSADPLGTPATPEEPAATPQRELDAPAPPRIKPVLPPEETGQGRHATSVPPSGPNAAGGKQLDGIVKDLKRRLKAAEFDTLQLQRQLDDAERDKLNAIQEMRRQRERANQTQRELRSERDRAEDLERRLHGLGQHVDPTDQFRHEVEVARARLVGDPAASSGDTAPRFVIGPDFLTTVDNIQGVRRSKVVEVVARLLYSPPGRPGRPQEHPLRTSEAGGSPQRTRADGARAFRVELQQSTPAARRLHYWRLPDGSIELANVVYHEDMTIT